VAYVAEDEVFKTGRLNRPVPFAPPEVREVESCPDLVGEDQPLVCRQKF